MNIHSNSALVPEALPGLAHRTLAGPEHGLRAIEVWSQCIDANGATPPHRHDCEEVVIVLDGEGTVTTQGAETRFKSGDTIILSPNEVHQLANTGQGPLRVIGVFGMAPVRAEFPDGTPIALPWQAPAT